MFQGDLHHPREKLEQWQHKTIINTNINMRKVLQKGFFGALETCPDYHSCLEMFSLKSRIVTKCKMQFLVCGCSLMWLKLTGSSKFISIGAELNVSWCVFFIFKKVFLTRYQISNHGFAFGNSCLWGMTPLAFLNSTLFLLSNWNNDKIIKLFCIWFMLHA